MYIKDPFYYFNSQFIFICDFYWYIFVACDGIVSCLSGYKVNFKMLKWKLVQGFRKCPELTIIEQCNCTRYALKMPHKLPRSNKI